MSVWSATELRAFLDGVADDRLAAAYLVLATTGMRRGEALGLRWSDVGLDARRAAIRQTVINVDKSTGHRGTEDGEGAPVVTLDAATALREHRRWQPAERLVMGAGFTDHGLVFCHPDGGLVHPERFSRQFARLGVRLGLPPVRLHDLRHGWATMALAAGVHPKVVQERLGHASIGITLDTYSHVTAALHADAAELIFRRPLANG
ncbi:MAG: site-specific integrase [Mycobacteriales bacterium]